MESYLDWINKVSSDTEIVPLYFVADFRISPIDKIKYDHEIPVRLCNYVDVYKNTYITSNIDFMEGTASENEIERFTIKDGDIMITKDSESSDDIGIPAIVKGDLDEVTVCGYHLALITPNTEKVVPKFLFYCFESKQHRLQIEIESTGVTRVGIPKDVISHYKIPLKSLTHQNKIVAYLDQEVAKIDALIEKKSRLVELLEEKKKATISQAVTKGLNPNVKLKPSGIDWLGDIPEHWEVNKISRVFSLIGSGTTPNSSNISYYAEGDLPWLNTGDLNDEYIYETSKHITQLAVDDHSTLKLFPKDSLVIAMYGATIGKTALTKIACYTNQACCVLNNSKLVSTRFAQFYFISIKETLVNLSNGGGQPNISQGIIRDFMIGYPSLNEQNEIITFLDKKLDEFQELNTKINNSINLLTEKRTAIISAAINGEININ